MKENVFQEVQKHNAAVTAAYPTNTVFVTMLYGSQNYLMDDEHSDVDTKVMMLPGFGDFALRSKLLSEELNVGEALSNVKDVRAMCQNFLSSNINFLECLFTEYAVPNPEYLGYWSLLQLNRDFLANCNPLRLMHAAHGMATQKLHALSKPFASKQALLEMYGYDAKQLYTLRRLYFFMKRYLVTPDFGACLVPSEVEREELWELKRYSLPLTTATAFANCTMEACTELLHKAEATFEKNPSTAAEAKEWYDEFCLDVLRSHLQNELLKGATLC